MCFNSWRGIPTLAVTSGLQWLAMLDCCVFSVYTLLALITLLNCVQIYRLLSQQMELDENDSSWMCLSHHLDPKPSKIYHIRRIFCRRQKSAEVLPKV